jgi:hypothetical protein
MTQSIFITVHILWYYLNTTFILSKCFQIFIFKILILFSYFLFAVLLILRLSEKLQVSQTLKSE